MVFYGRGGGQLACEMHGETQECACVLAACRAQSEVGTAASRIGLPESAEQGTGKMTFWMYEEARREWHEKENVLVALAIAFRPEWRGQILLTSQQPSTEKEVVCATLEIIRRVRNDLPVIVGTPHPTIRLAEEFRNSGATELWAVNLGHAGVAARPALEFADRMSINQPICPALHIREGEPLELSVCGKRGNRLILVMGHFRKWCLSNYQTCPYWRRECNDC